MTKRIYPFVLLFLFLVGCAPSKKTIGTSDFDVLKPNKVWRALEDKDADWESYSSRVSSKYKDPYASLSFSAKVRLQKDSALWVSISAALGIEVVRAYITPTRVQVINRLQKNYLDTDFATLSNQLGAPVSFKTLQSVFSGTPFFDWEKGDFYTEIDSMYYRFSNAPIGDSLPLDFVGLLENLSVTLNGLAIEEQEIIEVSSNRRLWLKTTAYTEVNGRPWPSSMFAEASDSTRTTSLQMRANKVETDIVLSFPFEIPEDYVPMR